MTIPQDIINLAAELQSGRNDGYAEDAIRKQLKEIRDYHKEIRNYINQVLKEDNAKANST